MTKEHVSNEYLQYKLSCLNKKYSNSFAIFGHTTDKERMLIRKAGEIEIRLNCFLGYQCKPKCRIFDIEANFNVRILNTNWILVILNP